MFNKKLLLCFLMPLWLACASQRHSDVNLKTEFEKLLILEEEASENKYTSGYQSYAQEIVDHAIKVNNLTGLDHYFLGRIAYIAEDYKMAIEQLKLAREQLDQSNVDQRMPFIYANSYLRRSFIDGGYLKKGESYYTNDPTDLAIFYSQSGQTGKAVQIYSSIINDASSTDEEVSRAMSMSILAWQSAGDIEQAESAFRKYYNDLSPNTIMNGYSRFAREYHDAGNMEKSNSYSEKLYDYVLTNDTGEKLLGGHVQWEIDKYEAEGDSEQLDRYIQRLRNDFKGFKNIMKRLDSRKTVQLLSEREAPELRIDYFLNGEKETLQDLRGKVVLLDFFSHWCGPCIKSFPFLRQLQAEYGSEGFVILGLTSVYGSYRGERDLSEEQEVARMRNGFKDKFEVTWPMVIDTKGENTRSYGVTNLPTVILIDRKGMVRFYHVGADKKGELKEVIHKYVQDS